jgi:short-subunit dehydrogenase
MARKNGRPKLKPVKDQVIVITGASSGIGLATARLAARRGASVVLAARNEPDLQKVTEEIRAEGGRATAVVADVSREDEVDRIGETALREFGAIDTWVNNAGLSIYGKLTEVPMADKRRLFDVNFWGVVNGCRTAVRFMKHRGGALINLGSEVSDRAIPLQGIYSASKHAVKGYTDALRMELEHDGVPISVTLVKPSAINTPYPEHARSYLEDGAPALPPPMYEPEVVARTILTCAEKPVRDIIVGGAGRAQVMLGAIAPRLTDKLMEGPMWKQQKRYDMHHAPAGNLDEPQRDGRAHGVGGGRVMKSSAYTSAVLSDVTRLLPFAAGAIAIAAGYRKWRSHDAAA